MASQIEIFNRAIVLLGEERVNSPTQDRKAATELNAIWQTTVNALLRTYRWGFAMKRAALAAMASTPEHQYEFQYLLPSDFLRLDFVGDFYVGSLSDYRSADESIYALAQTTSGTVIETDLTAPLNVRYVATVASPTRYDALFTEALAAKLAVDTAYTLTNSAGAAQNAARAFGMAINAAISVGAIERPPTPLPDDSWVTVRL